MDEDNKPIVDKAVMPEAHDIACYATCRDARRPGARRVRRDFICWQKTLGEGLLPPQLTPIMEWVGVLTYASDAVFVPTASLADRYGPPIDEPPLTTESLPLQLTELTQT